MPQMSPLSWLLLFIMFLIAFLIFNVLNYFSFLYPVKSKATFTKKHKINWKW
uniref:ATP synthase complex subunit 8 n=1 Tax=Cheironitis sp. MJTNT-2012 TaxID=2558026 RepID=S4SUU8_9SCAR|nr:ATP synthase F0 subunit 8 [Propomacrus bimucronatus]AFQ62299.1 ATP synthase F0 subunit 8 [Cheironitis sp. MJTNT-2012]WBP61428.1 ATP synthase F0 subunit 8 [Propomacrus bimucronatus]